MFIDTHCHLSLEDYDNISAIIDENRKSGIEKIIISGCTKVSIVESLELSSKYDDVYLTLGYHPSEVNDINDDDLFLLKEQLCSNKVVGVGEIGLDYHYGTDDIELQKELFRKQMSIAEKLKLPVVIHSRDAVSDTINILKEFPKVKGVIHCFSGSYETAMIYISMGYKMGIGGVLTFKNSKLSDVVKRIGINNIVLETDSPYLSPEPFRGEKNSSKNIPYIAKKLSEIFDISIDEVSKVTLENTYELFDLK